MKHYLLLLLLYLPIIGYGQIITTWAGNGINANSGDGGLAINASINAPYSAIFDKKGNFYTVSPNTHRVRKISSDGIITAIAGDGTPAFSGDGGLAVNAQINSPRWVHADDWGNVYICDGMNRRIRKIDTNGIINTIAGNGNAVFAGDGGPAIAASMVLPNGVYVDSAGNVYSCEGPWIRKIDTNGIINTIMGTGTVGFSGDGGPASAAQMNASRMYMDAQGNITIIDYYRIRRVDANTGIINTIAGNGTGGYNGDEISALSAGINTVALAWDDQNRMYIADLGNDRVRMVDGAGIIHTVAGTGTAGFSGDGGLATLAEMFDPTGVAFDSCGNLYIPSKQNHRVRKVTFNDSCGALSVKRVLSFSSFTLSPNPAFSQITITGSTKLKSIIVTNTVGAVVKSVACRDEKEVVDIGELSSGMYFVKVVDVNGGVSVEKMVKE